MIVLLGESGSGKTSIANYLVEKYGYVKIVTYTTRQARHDEEDGVDYHFINKSKFCELESEGFFAETAVYNGWYYGTAKEDCKDGTIAVLTPHGLRQLKKIDGLHITSFYIYVSRRDRLIKALQRGDNIEEAYRRSLSDIGQFDGVKDEVDYAIRNIGYAKSIEEMARIIVEFNTYE